MLSLVIRAVFSYNNARMSKAIFKQSDYYDVIVVGAGHAGCEAAISAAKLGASTLLITTTLAKVATLPCNPSIGGPGKGHLVREIGALGGVMAKIADSSAIQMKELNTSKGPAVRAYRAQIEQSTYNANMLEELIAMNGLEFYEDEVKQVTSKSGQITGVITGDGTHIGAGSVIICTGTFMTGKIIMGDKVIKDGGRMDEKSSLGLTDSLSALGLEHGRLKTGTPPRLAKDSLDYSKMELAPGSAGSISFSYPNKQLMNLDDQIPCYGTYTTPETHKLILDNLALSPIYNGLASERAPRSCPSLDRKVMNFPDRDRHPIFIEPTGRSEEKMYIQGGSLAFPPELQEAIIHTIPGLEKAKFLAYGYSVVYDFFFPHQLKNSLETKVAKGLFMAGQINGTTGYEEAAAQGLIAGINAARLTQSKPAFTLGRDQAYIGVLIDDLVTKIHVEPYRMFTSRAEYRLLLRNDNADLRLTKIGYELGLIDKPTMARVKHKSDEVNKLSVQLKKVTQVIDEQRISAWQYLSRPEIDMPRIRQDFDIPAFDREIDEQLELEAKYSGYFAKQLRFAEKLSHLENSPMTVAIAYDEIKGLRNEARLRLKEVSPATLGQAGRIQGVTPADLSILMIAQHRLIASAAAQA